MQIKVKWNEDSALCTVDGDESSFWKAVAQHLLDIEEIPNRLEVESPYGDACFTVNKRGKYIKDGVEKPSMYVTESYNYVTGLAPSTYEQSYLTCVNPESNNYKFYWLKPGISGIGATYGRIGSERGEMFGTRDLQQPYKSYLYWIRYYEKLSKGYTDMSDVYLQSSPVKKKAVKAPLQTSVSKVSKASQQLYIQLKAYAHHVVETSLKNSTVTVEQVRASKKFLNQMGQRKTVSGFNAQLLNLLAVCPRKVRHVNELLAQSKSDFANIMYREENLIAAMEAVAGDLPDTKTSDGSFEDLGIEVYFATDKQKNEVLRHLSDTLKPQVKTVYRVINKAHKKRFDAYLKDEHIKTVKQLWHGSRNENWFSILDSGLQLNPNARITGKMFGHGIYFAPSSMKSWNYTSYYGTSWANGNEDRGFMGLYATAYGKPLDVYAPNDYTQSALKQQNKNCVHAHAGNYLYNDEIIFYSESAMLLNYIVEFE